MAATIACQANSHAQDYSVNPDDFWSLDVTEQKRLIEIAYERRLAISNNLEFKSVQQFGNSPIDESMVDPAVLGQLVLKNANVRTFDMFSLDGSYKLLATKMHARETQLKQDVVSVFDVKEGIHRGIVQTSAGQIPPQGLIDNAQDIVDKTNRLMYWYYPANTELGESLIEHLLETIAEGTVNQDGGSALAKVVLPWGDPGEPNPAGTKAIWLDLTNDFVFTKGIGTKVDRDTGDAYFFHAFTVLDTKQVGGVSVPVELREAISNDFSEPNGKAAIYDIKITGITYGALTPDDLAFEFPDGTFVVDKIRGQTFVVGGDGAKSSIQPLLDGLRSSPPSNDNRALASSWRIWLLLFNVGLIFLGVSYLLVKRGGKQRPQE